MLTLSQEKYGEVEAAPDTPRPHSECGVCAPLSTFTQFCDAWTSHTMGLYLAGRQPV